MATVYYCNDPLKKHCSWSGYVDEMVCQESDKAGEEEFNHCPNCEGTDFQEDEEDDEG